jgi:hypothetical protein
MEARIPIMATVIMSSIKVNPWFFLEVLVRRIVVTLKKVLAMNSALWGSWLWVL